MRVLIVTAGSRGDVVPFTGLGQRLQQAGHPVSCASAGWSTGPSGPPPVFVGFGSMTPAHERLHEVVAAAVGRARVRAVVQSGWADLGPVGDDILVVGDLHEWLFPRTAAVVHHAGAGTAAAGLRAASRRSRCPSWSTSRSGRSDCFASGSHRPRCRCRS